MFKKKKSQQNKIICLCDNEIENILKTAFVLGVFGPNICGDSQSHTEIFLKNQGLIRAFFLFVFTLPKGMLK